MDIQDILRGLPFPVQGALMSLFGAQGQSGNGASNGQSTGAVDPRRQSLNGLEAFDGSYDAMGNYTGMGSGILSQPATATATPAAPAPAPVRPRQFPKDEAGFESLITRVMANDSGAAPQVPTLPVTEVPNLPPVAAAMTQQYEGPSAASLAPDNRDVGGGQNFAMQGPATPERGFFDKLLKNEDAAGNTALMHIMRGLGAAGSADPMKAMAQFAAQDTENMKLSEARRRANMPKVDHIAGTPYFQITKPDGTTQMSSNPGLAKFYESQSDSKLKREVEKMVLQGQITQTNQQASADNKTAAEARPMLSDIQSLKDRWTQAQGIVANQGTSAQLQGIPGISSISGFFGGDEVAKNKFLEGLTVDETLLNTARTKGAISNQEMTLFKSPIPSITDDREKVWKPWIEQRLAVLDKMEKFQASEVARGERGASPGNPAAPAAAPAAPAASGGVARPSSKAQYDALPSGAKYIAPNGMELTKK